MERQLDKKRWKRTNEPSPASYAYKKDVLAKERSSQSYSFFKKPRETIAVETAKQKKNIPASNKYTYTEASVYKPMRKF